MRLDAKVDDAAGAPQMCVQLSWDGGVSWTAAQSTPTLGTAEASYFLGGPANSWGRVWNGAELNNANFRLRIINVAANTVRDFSLDWVAVNVHYWDSGATVTPEPTATPSATATTDPGSNSGLVSPQLDAAGSSGDGNGFQLNANNAYQDDGLRAEDRNSGVNNSTACNDSGKDSHRFYGYSFNLPAEATINGIMVRLDASVDGAAASPKMCVQLSWDGGANWTAVQTTPLLGTSETTYFLGGPADSWGHAWSAAELNGGQLQVRVTNVSSSTARHFYLDWVAVQVYYE